MSLSDKKRDTLADRAPADPDKRDERGQTPLAGAAFKGLVEVAEALVEGGASVNAAGAALGATEAAAVLANL